ncbi:uncharacterized protein LOC144475892 [Augochlora pura]
MDECRQAISFANCYFSLADGLVSGLENHLSENVVLDWFGRTVSGKENVAAFMLARNEVNSRHVFKNIVPKSDIGYTRKSAKRRKSLDGSIVRGETSSEADMPVSTNSTVDYNQNEIDPKEIAVANKECDTSYDFNEGDLSNLFKLEISSTNIQDIEQSINRIKLEEEMPAAVKPIKRQRNQEDESVIVKNDMKYIEADGYVDFSRKIWRRGKDDWDPNFWGTSTVQKWRRHCKLQIAYFTLTEHSHSVVEQPCKHPATCSSQPKAKLLSLEEINEVSDRLVPNKNDFNGFLKVFDFVKDRKGFLANLETEMLTKDSLTPSIVPQYVENKLVFNKRNDKVNENDQNERKFVSNYQVYLIIYESTSRSRSDHFQKFKNKKVTEMEIPETEDQPNQKTD